MAPVHPCSSFYLWKILAKSCFTSKSPSIWRPGLPYTWCQQQAPQSSKVSGHEDHKEVETTFRGRSVVSVQEQHKSGADQISHTHPCCGVGICKELIQIYLLAAVFFCHVCGGGHGGLGQRSRSSALWKRIAEKPTPCRKPFLPGANIFNFASDSIFLQQLAISIIERI